MAIFIYSRAGKKYMKNNFSFGFNGCTALFLVNVLAVYTYRNQFNIHLVQPVTVHDSDVVVVAVAFFFLFFNIDLLPTR